ncbi:MAG: rRNA maturation RNase YbeY [Chitinophagales bacterium]
MENSEINFFAEDITLPAELNDDFKLWIQRVIAAETHELSALNYIFCSDEYLLNINNEYLDHDYYTDIITFDNSEEELMIEGDIFISVDRVADNATSLNIPFSEELKRVMAHGVLHLCGFGDKSEEEAKLMRQKEEQAINLF